MSSNRYKDKRDALKNELKSFFHEDFLGVIHRSSRPLLKGFGEFIRRRDFQHKAWLVALQLNRTNPMEKAKSKRINELTIGAWLNYGVEKFELPRKIFVDDVKANLSDSEFKRLCLYLVYEVKKFQEKELDEIYNNTPDQEIELPPFSVEEILEQIRPLEAELLEVRKKLNSELQGLDPKLRYIFS